MARPRKKGLDYFPMDVNMLDSDIAVAITGKFDYVGFQCMLRILCSIYKNGYWIDFDEIFKLKLSSNLRIDNGKVEEIVNTLVEWKYFDKEIFDKYNVLTNAEIQEQYFFIVARNRNRIDDDLPYLLAENLRIIDNNCHLPQENTELFAENYDESDISREFTAGKLTENLRKTNGKPAEKGGNKIKENKTKENIYLDSSAKASESSSSMVDDAASASRKIKLEKTRLVTELVEYYNQRIIEKKSRLPSCVMPIPEHRKSAVGARMDEFGEDAVRKVIDNAVTSSFLNEKKFGLDWIMGPKNFPKVLEGKYNDEKEHQKQEIKEIDYGEQVRLFNAGIFR